MLRKAQANHQGLEASLRNPCMKDNVERKVSCCTICQEFFAGQPHMKMQTHEVPDYNKQYLILTDSAAIIVMKVQVAQHGILAMLITDNATCFTSAEFQAFYRTWHFQHSNSSPYRPRGNGKAEVCVKIANNIMKECLQTKSGPWLALLEWRNITMSGLRTSTVQRLISRRTRTQIPTSTGFLKPRVS
ncbi:hypothetical protein PR048_001786 [Dryococelus australis]|uniref:Integrase catalytic domain-containing protein n=1 Tax=Dryococelus australis TaxID=614101 RepID=A0ABQ9IIF6_9NEOP|nr:hypothetical protein PR048_001786 [Dryococelus australis]